MFNKLTTAIVRCIGNMSFNEVEARNRKAVVGLNNRILEQEGLWTESIFSYFG
jgi:hypothetical protein